MANKYEVKSIPYPIVYPFTEKSKLIIQKGMTGATGNLYCGLHEYCDMSFLLHFLRKGDTFADIGANIGSYTILASAHVGAKIFAFEPVGSTFLHLLDNIAINRLQNNVITFNVALGSSKGTIDFTSSLDTTNHVANENEVDTISVPVETLDDALENQQCPSLLKIDVEGFETEVLIGGNEILKNKELKAIIIELNGSGKRYGYDEQNIHKMLIELNFKPFLYNPEERTLTSINEYGTHNTIYIRDIDFVQNRLKSADKFKILGYSI
jgi:FkbM family methyltransferase